MLPDLGTVVVVVLLLWLNCCCPYAHTLTGDTLNSLSNITPEVLAQRIDTTLAELGLTDVAHQRIGNAIQRGISGGQKRRVTLGAALVTMPKILLLDEPTSGLDSRASREVIQAGKYISLYRRTLTVDTFWVSSFVVFFSYSCFFYLLLRTLSPRLDTDDLPVKNIAVRHGMIVIASIHQPNWETFALFDKLLLLAQGQTMYFGPIGGSNPPFFHL